METIIYQLKSKNNDIKKCYIGSSRDIRQRKYLHKSRCNNENGIYYNLNIYKFIRDNGGYENWEYKILDTITTDDKKLQKIVEQFYILQYEKLNMIRAFTTEQDFKNDRKITSKTYYDKNKEQINKKQRELYLEKKAERETQNNN